MKAWMAILMTIWLLAACILISSLIDFDVTWIMVLGTTLWAAMDSSKIEFKRDKGCVGPVRLFITCGLLWIVGFPWYLAKRQKIMTGKAVLKEEARSGPAEPIACISCGTTM